MFDPVIKVAMVIIHSSREERAKVSFLLFATEEKKVLHDWCSWLEKSLVEVSWACSLKEQLPRIPALHVLFHLPGLSSHFFAILK